MQLAMYQMLTTNNPSISVRSIDQLVRTNHHKPRKRLSHQRKRLEGSRTTSE